MKVARTVLRGGEDIRLSRSSSSYSTDDHDKEGIKMAESRNRTLKDAREMMNFLTGGDELKRMREKWELERNWDLQIAEGKGERKGIKKGKKEGIKQTQLQIAKEMLKNNVEMEIIMKCTGLTQENIKKSKTSNNK